MYTNLEAEMARKKIKNKRMAKEIGVRPTTFSMKMNGKSDFTLEEAFKIKVFLGVDIPLDVLFAKTESLEM